jgi:hypothetical protein
MHQKVFMHSETLGNADKMLSTCGYNTSNLNACSLWQRNVNRLILPHVLCTDHHTKDHNTFYSEIYILILSASPGKTLKTKCHVSG